MWDAEGELLAVVFISDRSGAALRRRERCLKLAGIVHGVKAERRPSGTYYKLCVRESDGVAAHLALSMGGCNRSLKLRETRSSLFGTLRELGQSLWDEARLLASRIADFVWRTAPRLLPAPVRRVAR